MSINPRSIKPKITTNQVVAKVVILWGKAKRPEVNDSQIHTHLRFLGQIWDYFWNSQLLWVPPSGLPTRSRYMGNGNPPFNKDSPKDAHQLIDDHPLLWENTPCNFTMAHAGHLPLAECVSGPIKQLYSKHEFASWRYEFAHWADWTLMTYFLGLIQPAKVERRYFNGLMYRKLYGKPCCIMFCYHQWGSLRNFHWSNPWIPGTSWIERRKSSTIVIPTNQISQNSLPAMWSGNSSLLWLPVLGIWMPIAPNRSFLITG